MLCSVYAEMKNSVEARAVPIYETCSKCLEVLYHFINIRKDELEKTKQEIKKIFTKINKTKKETA
jgi:hypothetical protein